MHPIQVSTERAEWWRDHLRQRCGGLKTGIPPQQSRYVAVARIKEAVCEYYGISLERLLERSRASEVVLPRQVAMYLARRMTKKSFPQIGRTMGGFDHTTVMSAVRSIETQMEYDAELGQDTETIKAGILNGW